CATDWSTPCLMQDTIETLLSFFFQAEDGIRDATVTGVQTCALPISCHVYRWHAPRARLPVFVRGILGGTLRHSGKTLYFDSKMRSEERRVGKECRSLWGGDR